MKKQGSMILSSLVLAAAVVFAVTALATVAEAQSFDCTKATARVEKMICEDDVLARLDTEMNDIYKQAMAKVSVRMKTTLRNEQRSWIRSRNACPDRDCVMEYYNKRIDRLKMAIAESAPSGPITFRCSGNMEFVATFSGPEKATIEIGDTVLRMNRVQSGSGAKYVGGGSTFWTKGSEATLEFRGKVYSCGR